MATRKHRSNFYNGDFEDSLDDAMDKVGDDISDVPAMEAKMDKFASTMDSYRQGKLPTGLGEFSLAMAGGESSSITSGIPALDEAIAEEEGGLFDSVLDAIPDDLFGDEITEAFDAGVAAAGGVANVMETAGGLIDNFSTMGQELAGEGFESLKTMATEAYTNAVDTKVDLVNMKKMFGLTGADMKAMYGGFASSSLVDKLAKQIKQVDFVTTIPINMSNGLPSVGDFINEKYPDLAEGMPDLGGAISDTLNVVSDPVNDIVSIVGDGINLIEDINKFGDIMGNPDGIKDAFLKGTMGKVDNILTSASASLQTDFFGNLPEIGDNVNKLLPGVLSKVYDGIPNLPSVDNAIGTAMPDMSGAVKDIADALPAIINAIPDYLSDATEMVNTAMPKIESILGDASLTLQRIDGTFPDVSEIVSSALPEIEKALGINIPDIPQIGTTVTDSIFGIIDEAGDTIGGMLDPIADVVSDLLVEIQSNPLYTDVMSGFDDNFVTAAIADYTSVLNSYLPELEDLSVQAVVDKMTPFLTDSVLKSIPNFPDVDSIASSLAGLVSDFSIDSLTDFIPTFDVTSIDVDTVVSVVGDMGSAIADNVGGMFSSVTSSFDNLQIDYDTVDNLVSQVTSLIDDSGGDILDSLKSNFPVVQDALPNITGYLDSAAGGLMDNIRGNMPAFSSLAQEGFGNLISTAQGFASANFGNLTDAAKGMLASVNIPFSLPSIDSMQIANAMKVTFANIENIQIAQYGLDMMDKAKEMLPEIESAIASFTNFSWEGSGFSLGAIGSYISDIGSTDDMSAIVSKALEGAPPLAQCSAKIAGAISQAKGAIDTISGKKAEAEAAIGKIKELFA